MSTEAEHQKNAGNRTFPEPEKDLFLVTGGGGFLGKAIVRRLISRGEKVRTFSRSYYPELEKFAVDQVQGDIADKSAVEKACKGVRTVFHTAARAGVWGPYADYFSTNVTGTRNVLRACRKYSVSEMIHSSSPSAVFDGNDVEGADESLPYPPSYHAHYPRTKAMAEQEVRRAAASGLKVIILRPHLIWGPGDNHLVPRILSRAGRLRIVGEGRKKVDTIYIDNAAHAHILAADRLRENSALSGKVYFISQDAPVPLWDMVNAILAAGGLPPIHRRISAGSAFFIGAACEGVYKLLRLQSEPPMTRFLARELATAHWFDIRAAKKDLGYRPAVSTEEGLSRLKEWLQSNPYNI